MTEVDLARNPPIHGPCSAEQAGVCPRCGSRIVGREPAVETAAESPLDVAYATRPGTGLLALLLLCAPSAIPAGIALVLLAEDEWIAHHEAIAGATLVTRTTSWYLGSNVEGKPRRLLSYIGGVGAYRQKCDEVAAGNYAGFAMQ